MTKYLPILLLIIISFSSCYPTIYFPDRVNTPGFTHKGEAKATIGVRLQNGDDNNNHVVSPVFDGAYAVSNHLGVMASYRTMLNNYVPEDNDISYIVRDPYGGAYNSHYFETGAGYFARMDKVGRFETYGGAGLGRISRRSDYTPINDFNSNYYKIFLQPAIHLIPSKGKIVNIGMGVRFTMLKYYNFTSPGPNSQYYVIGSDPTSKYNTTVTDKPFALFEPFINAEVGYKFVKFNFQLCGNTPVNDGRRHLGSFPAFTMGLVFHYTKEYFR